MLPDIRAVIATMAIAIGLLITAFGITATLRVAQESRAGSLHAELARRGQAVAVEPQPIVVIETPGPMLLARAPEIEPLPPASAELEVVATEPSRSEKEQASQPVAAIAEGPPVASASTEPDSNEERFAPASPAVPEDRSVAATERETEPTIVAAAPETIEPQAAPPSPAPILALGGPSPEEIAQAKAQRKAAERARARKAATEKRKKARAARIARERKLAAQRVAEAQAKQQASASSPQSGFAFTPSNNSAPFGNTFGAATR
jgi:hypothetical protein